MAAGPQRRENPAQLDARLIPVERALLARAAELEQASHVTGSPDEYPVEVVIARLVESRMAAEWRKLAEELHYW